MADYHDFKLVACFLPQTALGTYNTTLDPLNNTLTEANGLLLGSADAGEQRSGITFKTSRVLEEKADVAASFSKSFSDFLRESVDTLTITFPFCGNRATASGSPADSEFTPIAAIDAILKSAGLTVQNWGSGVGREYIGASATPMSVLLFNSEGRYELLDCFSVVSIDFTPGTVPKATATISVGSVKEFSNVTFPTSITYGNQSSVSAPVCESMLNTWSEERGFDALTLEIGGTIEDVPDSNAVGGNTKLQTERTISLKGTVKGDSTGTSEVFEHGQLVATALGTLTAWTWRFGTDATAGLVIKAASFSVPKPEVQSIATKASGGKQAWEIEAIAKSASVLNDELSIIFR